MIRNRETRFGYCFQDDVINTEFTYFKMKYRYFIEVKIDKQRFSKTATTLLDHDLNETMKVEKTKKKVEDVANCKLI